MSIFIKQRVFCNWLQNQAKPGLAGSALTENGAYTLNGNSGPLVRNAGAIWFIPNENEWYKPAYYKGGGVDAGYWNFANRSDWAPSNLHTSKHNGANYYCSNYTKQGPPYLTPVTHFKESVGTYNTYDMSGNVAEWITTTENDETMPLKYVARGGSWRSCYYGNTLGASCDVADWGIELSKWARPSYDPAEGYDNIGFRVATSLIAAPSAPVSKAPGAMWLSPIKTLETSFGVLAGVGMIFSGKAIYNRFRAVDPKEAIQIEDEEGRARDASALEEDPLPSEERPSTPTEFQKKVAEWNNPSRALIANRKDLTSENLSIGLEDKNDIENSMNEIDGYFEKAMAQHQIGRRLLEQKENISEEELDELKKMCDAYDKYAHAIVTTAEKIKDRFPGEHGVWIPWWDAAMKTAIEAILLWHTANRPYYLYNDFGALDESLKKKK